MFISAVLIFFISVLGTLAIAFVIPEKELSFASGVMQAIQYFFGAENLSWLTAPMAVLVTIGGVVLMAAWLIGPAKGLGVVAEEGNMPPFFNRINKHGAPVPVLVTQAAIGTIVSLLYVFIPSVNQAYWILSAMTVELLCIVYVLVFAAVIKLRYSSPDTPRAFKIPGGLVGVWLVGGIGAFGVIFTFIIGILPPDLGIQHTWAYVFAVLFGTFILAVPPLIFMKMKKPEWGRRPKK